MQHFIDVPAVADRAFAAGVREMIIVMPNAYTRYQGSMYSSSLTTGDWENFIARELVAYIDSHYRTISNRMSRGLAGHSMGGYGTLRIGMKHPDVFSSIYALSVLLSLNERLFTAEYSRRRRKRSAASKSSKRPTSARRRSSHRRPRGRPTPPHRHSFSICRRATVSLNR